MKPIKIKNGPNGRSHRDFGSTKELINGIGERF